MMLIKVGLLLLSVGIYVSYAEGRLLSAVEKALFKQLDSVFPDNFLTKYPENSEFFSLKVIAYVFFNLFSEYFGEKEPRKFWSKFNRNDFSRVAIDAAFYEYLTYFADIKVKRLVFDPLEDSESNPEDVAVHRIGDYLDNLSATDQSETRSQATETEDYGHLGAKCSKANYVRAPTFGVPGQDYPDYCDIPQTSFTCANKPVPGMYADVETRCQVFHACWPHRMDSYLCPIGTTFDQALLTCDLWHESDCSLAPFMPHHYLSVKAKTPGNADPTVETKDETQTTSESPAATVTETDIPKDDETCRSLISKLQFHMRFLPVKCRFSVWETISPETTSKPVDRLLDDVLSGNFRDAFGFMTKRSAEEEVKRKLPASKLDSKVLKAATESTLEDSDAHEDWLATELPSEDEDAFPPRINSKFLEKSTSQMNRGRSVRKSTLLKPSEDTIRQVFDTMVMSLEAGGRLLNEGLLPLVEKMVLDSRRKKLVSKS